MTIIHYFLDTLDDLLQMSLCYYCSEIENLLNALRPSRQSYCQVPSGRDQHHTGTMYQVAIHEMDMPLSCWRVIKSQYPFMVPGKFRTLFETVESIMLNKYQYWRSRCRRTLFGEKISTCASHELEQTKKLQDKWWQLGVSEWIENV